MNRYQLAMPVRVNEQGDGPKNGSGSNPDIPQVHFPTEAGYMPILSYMLCLCA